MDVPISEHPSLAARGYVYTYTIHNNKSDPHREQNRFREAGNVRSQNDKLNGTCYACLAT